MWSKIYLNKMDRIQNLMHVITIQWNQNLSYWRSDIEIPLGITAD